MTTRDLGWLLIVGGAILGAVQLLPHVGEAGAALLALAIGVGIYRLFGE